MPEYFLDTSALAKYYHQEVGTNVVEQVLHHPASSIFISRLTTVELHSVFARRVRTQALGQDAFQLLRQRFFADIVEGDLTVVRVTDDHYGVAQDLLGGHATERGLRTLDALQLAVAVDLREIGLLDFFMCSDVRLCEAAAHEGLPVLNPEAPAEEPSGESESSGETGARRS